MRGGAKSSQPQIPEPYPQTRVNALEFLEGGISMTVSTRKVNVKPKDLDHMLGTSSLNDLLRDATKVDEIGLQWAHEGILDYVVAMREEEHGHLSPLINGLVMLCQAEQQRRDIESQDKPADPVYFRIVPIPEEFLGESLVYCSERCLTFRQQRNMPAALFFYLAGALVIEQMRAAGARKN